MHCSTRGLQSSSNATYTCCSGSTEREGFWFSSWSLATCPEGFEVWSTSHSAQDASSHNKYVVSSTFFVLYWVAHGSVNELTSAVISLVVVVGACFLMALLYFSRCVISWCQDSQTGRSWWPTAETATTSTWCKREYQKQQD